MESQSPPLFRVKAAERKLWKDKLALWIIGLQSRFGFVTLMVAAYDIMSAAFPKEMNTNDVRECHEFSTGLILVLACAPVVLAFSILPYLPNHSKFIVTISMLINIVGYFLMASGLNRYVTLTSIVLISLGFGIGDYQSNQLRIMYPYKVSRCYESGGIHAEFIAAFYFILLRFFDVKMTYIFLSLVSLPVLGIGCFWFLLQRPQMRKSINDINTLTFFNLARKSMSFEEKMQYTGYLMKYVMPLGFMCFLRGFVNQGLYEFIQLYDNKFRFDFQYSFNIFCFNVGFYACLVTRNVLKTDYVCKCIIFQLLVALVFLIDALFAFIPYIWIIWLLAYVQGITHGVAHTSVFDKMLENEPSELLYFARSAIKSTIVISSLLAGGFDFGVHYVITRTPKTSRLMKLF